MDKIKLEQIDNIKVGNRIKELRKNKHLSQQQLAEMIPTCRSAICKMESGENGLSLQTASDLASIFNVSLEYLLYGDKTYFSTSKFKFTELEKSQGIPFRIIYKFLDILNADSSSDLYKAFCLILHYCHMYRDIITDAYKKNRDEIEELGPEEYNIFKENKCFKDFITRNNNDE